MLVNTNIFCTHTPISSTSTSNTLEPTNTSTNSSSFQLRNLQESSSSVLSLQTGQKQYIRCISTFHLRPQSRATSILDSPTLVRVERARLRLKADTQEENLNDSCISIANNFTGENILEVKMEPNKQSLLKGRLPMPTMTGPIKRGLLWQQRDRLFSRWKERYFVLTRDYLHCFKRASGSANERASDMGQFTFKVKLVDVEKVEWVNRRSYSAIGLLLGREGKVLLRCDEGLEDWFELLEECTLTSKERRKALKIAQGPRSRASLAAPISHSSLQSKHFGLGGTYSTALDDWIITSGNAIGIDKSQKLVTGSICGNRGTNPFLYSESVPDLSVLNNENHEHVSGLSTNHSTPQRIYSANNNISRHSNSYTSQNIFSNCNGLYGSPQRILINKSLGSTQIVDEEIEEGEVELRRPRILRHLSAENGNDMDRDWMYRKPKAPTDIRHSAQPILPTHNYMSSNKLISDLDCSAHDSGLDTPSSIHRPSSYREQPRNKKMASTSPRNSTEIFLSSLGTNLNSAVTGGSFCNKNVIKLNQDMNKSCDSVQERILKIRNKEFCTSIKSTNILKHNEQYDSNQNHCFKNDNQSFKTLTQQQSPMKSYHLHSHNQQVQQDNGNDKDYIANNNNDAISVNVQNRSSNFGEHYQHPVLTAIINESQGINFSGILKNKLSTLW